MQPIHATTILCVRKDGRVAMGGDGQVTVGDTVMKAHAHTLFEKFEEKLERFPGNLARAAVELAKDWRSDRVLRRLEAQLIVADKSQLFTITGQGDVIEPDEPVLAIGSGGAHAPPGARAAGAPTAPRPPEE